METGPQQGASRRRDAGAGKPVEQLSAVVFPANSVGYLLGAALNETFGGAAGMLLWGAAYGLFLGAGLGAVLHLAQARRAHSG